MVPTFAQPKNGYLPFRSYNKHSVNMAQESGRILGTNFYTGHFILIQWRGGGGGSANPIFAVRNEVREGNVFSCVCVYVWCACVHKFIGGGHPCEHQGHVLNCSSVLGGLCPRGSLSGRPPERTWDQAAKQEVTSYRPPLPPGPSAQNDRHA